MGIFSFLFKIRKQRAQSDNSDNFNSSLLDKESRKKSEYYYSIHQKKLKSVDVASIDCSKIKPRKLSSVELSFLKYLNNCNVDNLQIAGYWTHEYNIDYKEVIPQFICQGLLEVHDSRELSSLKIVDLKNILTTKSLPRSGNKVELIERIEENFTSDELKQYLIDGNRYYRLTPKVCRFP